MAAVMMGGMVPHLAIACATFFFRNRFTNEERKSGMSYHFRWHTRPCVKKNRWPPPSTPTGAAAGAMGPSETAPEIAPSADGAWGR